ncbi:hypothetical protein ABT061_15975 [Streptosporangium sp. NPDC002544]
MSPKEITQTLAALDKAMKNPGRPTVSTSSCTGSCCMKGGKK